LSPDGATNKKNINGAKMTMFYLTKIATLKQNTKNIQFNVASIIKWHAVIALARKGLQELSQGFEFQKKIEQATVAFTVMSGSAETAAKIMGDLKNLQQNSMMGLGEGADATRQMMAYGFAADEVVDQMKMLAKVGAAVGVSMTDMSYVYGTLRSQGRAYTRDLMQFAMRGVPIYDELAKVMGTTSGAIKDLAADGAIGTANNNKNRYYRLFRVLNLL
jgi:hypothetical protein